MPTTHATHGPVRIARRAAEMSALRSVFYPPRLLAAGVPAVLLVMLALVAWQRLDQPLMLWLNHHLLLIDDQARPLPQIAPGWSTNGLTLVAAWWSSLTVLGLGLSALLLMMMSPQPQRSARFAAFLLCLIVAGLGTHALKRTLDQPRPFAVLGSQIVVVGQALHYHSMPSGHATTAFAWAALMLLIPRGAAADRNRTARRTGLQTGLHSGSRAGLQTGLQTGVHAGWRVTWVLGGAACVALSRIAVGAHWPLDILAGAALGWLSALLCIWLAQRSGLAQWCASRWGWRLMAATRIGCGVAMCLIHTGYPLAVPAQWGLGLFSIALGAWDLWAAFARHASAPTMPKASA